MFLMQFRFAPFAAYIKGPVQCIEQINHSNIAVVPYVTEYGFHSLGMQYQSQPPGNIATRHDGHHKDEGINAFCDVSVTCRPLGAVAMCTN